MTNFVNSRLSFSTILSHTKQNVHFLILTANFTRVAARLYNATV